MAIPSSLVLSLAGCGASAPPPDPLTVQITLSTAEVPAGQTINGILVIENQRSAFDLSQAVPGHCYPEFAITLARGSFRNSVGFQASCLQTSFVIAHGATRIPFMVTTTYTECGNPGGSSLSSIPPCLAGNRLPTLPKGSYHAVIVWSSKVPLPTPTPVPVILK